MQLTEKQLNNFFKKVNKIPGGCWLWTGTITPLGYGLVTLFKHSHYVHRISYMVFKGEIQEGLELDHFYCQTRNCVNPDHLEAVTHYENLLRSNGITTINKQKTHCIHGHEFSPENTYIASRKGHGLERNCKTCYAIRRTTRRKSKKSTEKEKLAS